jgi:serpin B
MMHHSDEDAVFGYAETETLQVLSIWYKGEEHAKFSMLVLLPKDNDLAAAESGLDPAELARLKSQLAYRQVIVHLPKFRLGTAYSLPSTLASMGMPTAFSAAADFSGMDGTKELLVNDVIHKAFIEVDEEGTEAAAATAELTAGAMPPGDEPEPVPVFRADHPFVFLIQDFETGTVLFMGRVTDPTA